MKSTKSDSNTIKTDTGKAVTGMMIIPVISEGKSNQVIELDDSMIIKSTNTHTHMHTHTHTHTHTCTHTHTHTHTHIHTHTH